MKEALIEYLDIFEQEDLREVLKTVNVPLLFINGYEDQICHRDTITLMRKLSPHAQVEFFMECGHFPFLSKPHEFNNVLEKFLKG